MRKLRLLSVAIGLACSFVLGACSPTGSESAGREIEFSGGTFLQTLNESSVTSAFAQMFSVAEPALELNPNAEYTLFVPVDSAIDLYLSSIGETLKSVLGNPELAKVLVLNHLFSEKMSGTNLLNKGVEPITSLGGNQFSVVVSESFTEIKGTTETGAKIIAIDIKSSNGIVHYVDAVLN